MPPRRRASGQAAKSQQPTLAFHGATNRVTKAGTKAQNAKKSLLSETAVKNIKREIIDLDVIDVTGHTTSEAAIIQQTEKETAAQQVESTPEEDQAKRISDAAIKKYWAAKEKQRMAPRVHQQDLSIHDKILREWDVSGQYGPCIGIARLKRWKRAHRLGLDPPIQVLAVLLKEQEGKDKLTVQRSHVDELLNAKAELLDAV